MRKRQLWMLALLVMVMAACKNNKSDDKSMLLDEAEQDTVTHAMKACDLLDTTMVGNEQVTFLIHRDSTKDMPVVTDDYGTKYYDNIFELTMKRDGQTFFNRKFTKQDFMQLLDNDFKVHGMFDGFRFNGYKDGIFTFSTCVSYPESDMSQPFFVKIAKDGTFNIEVDNTPLDNAPDEDMPDSIGDGD